MAQYEILINFYVPSESIQHQWDILHAVAVRLAQRRFFLPCTEYLELFWKNGTEKQASAAIFLIPRCNICKNCPSSKNVCKDMARRHIVITDFFIRQRKIILDRQFFPSQCGSASFSNLLLRQVIHDRVRPRISYEIKVFIFIHNGNKPFFTYQLLQRMITFFFVWNMGIIWCIMEAASSSFDSFFCHMRYPSGTER